MTVSTNPSVANGYTDLSGAQVAAGATGVAGVTSGGALMGSAGSSAQIIPAESVSSLMTGDLFVSRVGGVISLPNPYPSQANAPVHPSVLFFPSGWNGAQYWCAFTPYPASVSDYENPCVACSSDGMNWVAKGPQPLAEKPTGGYNSDTALFMSPDGLTMYCAYRERLTTPSISNTIKVFSSTDGVSWSGPTTLFTGASGDDAGSPSFYWNGTAWVCVAINIDTVAPWAIRRRTSTSSSLFGGWNAWTTVTLAPPSGRSWWHASVKRLSSGQVVGLFQDNASSAGAGGFLWWAESSDDAATFTLGEPLHYGAGAADGTLGVRDYRSDFIAYDTADGTRVEVFEGDLANFNIRRHVAIYGKSAKKSEHLTKLTALIAAGTSQPAHGLWADGFTRADSAVTLGTAASGGTYTVTGTWGISTNRAYPVANGAVLAATGSADHEATVRFTDMTTSVQQWLTFRAVDASNRWRVGVLSPPASGQCIVTLQSVVAGSVSINREIGSLVRGDYLTARAKGNIVEICVNGCPIHREYMTTSLTGASCGFQANIGANTFFDDFVVCRT